MKNKTKQNKYLNKHAHKMSDGGGIANAGGRTKAGEVHCVPLSLHTHSFSLRSVTGSAIMEASSAARR